MSGEEPGGPEQDWLAPEASGPVRAVVRLPGSKSITNRALLLAALSDGPAMITGPLIARDTVLMAQALRALGCQIAGPGLPEPGTGTGTGIGADTGGTRRDTSRTGRDVQGRDGAGAGGQDLVWRTEPGQPAGAAAVIDVGNAGTVLRFVPPLAALTGADVTFTGDARVSRRPVGQLLTALRELGARIDDHGTGAAPFIVHGTGKLPGGTVTIDASASSQFVSALLLAAPRFDQGVAVRHQGPPVPSAPHIEMTVRMLRACGAEVSTEGGPAAGPDDGTGGAGVSGGAGNFPKTWRVRPGSISLGQITIEPDLSSALPFLAAALATGGEVMVAGWPAGSLQAADRIIELLTWLGATVSRTAAGLMVSGTGEIQGIRADLSAVGELTPVVTALAALAASPSELTGIGHLRAHESDRLAALAGEIGKLGGAVTELPDGLRIVPRPLRAGGVVFDSHDDHRLVMAAAVLGLVVPGLRVGNAETASKTFPGFTRFWTRSLDLAR